MRDERAARAVESVPPDIRFTTFHVIDPSGEGFSGGAAVVRTLSSIRATSWIGRFLARKPLRLLVDAFYAALVRSKGALGKMVKDAPGPIRWP